MNRQLIHSFVFSLVAAVATSAFALTPSADELKAVRDWQRKIFEGEAKDLPFTFAYDGKDFRSAGWTKTKTKDGYGFKDPTGTIVASLDVRTYPDYPVVSWLLRFTNVSSQKSGVISGVKNFDLRVPVASKPKYHLIHHAAGAMQSLDDYQQFTTVISQDWWRQHRLHLETRGGRSCESCWPYFNIETPDANAGMIAALGWSGQWQADFDAMGDACVKLTAGMSDSRFYLNPGESVRGPRAIALLYKRGDWVEGQNIWRQWFLAYNEPRVDGKIVPYQTMASYCCAGGFEKDDWAAASHKQAIDMYAQHGFQIDYWWIDAAWYEWKSQWNDEAKKEPHWRWTGNYDADPKRFPKGPAEAFDYARSRVGAKDGILWFELERVVPSARVYQAHPEYFYSGNTGRGFFLNLGNPRALDWGIKTVNGTLAREHSDYFRLDFNFPCLHFWRGEDAKNGEKNRCGIAEMKHIEAFYKLYESVLAVNPKKRRIDNCSQGGCRNDVEALSYSAPLWRTDTSGPISEQQMQTLGISLWVPLYGGGAPHSTDVYELRSRLMPYLYVGVNYRRSDMSWANLKTNYELWKKIRGYYIKDYYPLTRSDKENDLWCGWEFVDAEAGEGFVQLFRREDAMQPSFIVKPRGLDAAKSYVFEDVDTRQTWEIRGDGSFEVKTDGPRTAKVILFRPADGGATVAILNDGMREFMARPRWERMGLLLDEQFRAAAIKAGSRPKPHVIQVKGGETLSLYKAATRELVRTYPVANGAVTIDNLEVGTKYVWATRTGKKIVDKGKFTTEDNVPRICRIEGAWGSGGGNVRDLGGWRTESGKRIRQGLLFRTAALNQTASTPKDKKDQWKPGRVLISPASAKEAVETFHFKTDLDFRNDEETYGMTGSPFGPSVTWAHVVSSNYEDMKNPKPAAAFAKDFRLCLDKKNLPLIFHCVGGADRTGTFAWLLEGILGLSEDNLYKDWELTVFHYPPLKFNHWNFIGGLTRWLGEKYPKMSMQEKCVAYAKDCGITDDEIARFREMMLE